MSKKAFVGGTIGVIVIAAIIVGGIYLASPKEELILQTTTSMDASGLLQLIDPVFEAKYHMNLSWVAVGTGQALTNAGNGDGDVVIAHSPASEKAFINHTDSSQAYSGKGICRVTFAYNYFIIVGPLSDPAKISETDSVANATRAFQKIYAAAESNPSIVKFVSRGDASGTHTKEQSIWSAAKVSPYNKSWYYSLGQGMAQTLTTSNETLGYTLTDYGTWLNMRKNLSGLLNITAQASDLKNTYSIMAVDPDKFEENVINFEGAMKLIHFMITDGLKIIEDYKIDGEQVFTVSLVISNSTCTCGSHKCEVENGVLQEYVDNNTPKPSTLDIQANLISKND